MIFRDYILIKKSSLLTALAVAAAGCLLYKHYTRTGNNICDDVEDLRDDARRAADKGRRKVKEAVDNAKQEA